MNVSDIINKDNRTPLERAICVMANVSGLYAVAERAAEELAAKDAEIARLTSEVAELRRLGNGMAERLELFSFYADLVKRNPSALRADAIFEALNAAALDGWERANKA